MMRRPTFILLAALSLSTSQTLYAGNILRLSDRAVVEGELSPPTRTVERSGPYTVVTYEFQSYGIAENPLAAGTYDLSAPYFSTVSNPGEPSTLFRVDALNVADPDAARFEILEAEFAEFKICLAPATPSYTMNEEPPTSLDPIAEYEGFKPLVPAEELDRFVHRGQGVARVCVTNGGIDAVTLYSGTEVVASQKIQVSK